MMMDMTYSVHCICYNSNDEELWKDDSCGASQGHCPNTLKFLSSHLLHLIIDRALISRMQRRSVYGFFRLVEVLVRRWLAISSIA